MEIRVGDLRPSDEDAADRIVRRAFGTFLGVPDPSTTFGSAELFRSRWRAPNTRVLAAYDGDELLGTNVLTRWGSLGWFGPLTITPERWDRGIATSLMRASEAQFDAWGVTHRGLFTFPQSAKHLGLYQRFGYWPGALTPILSRPARADPGDPGEGVVLRRFSEAPSAERPALLTAVRAWGDALYPGLDLTGEIGSIDRQRLGDTLLQFRGAALSGLAICHVGAGSEAESGSGYLKFGAIAPGDRRAARREGLVRAAESLVDERGGTEVVVGVNLAHREAYEALRSDGYRAEFVGVAMHAPHGAAYHRPELDVLDDWR